MTYQTPTQTHDVDNIDEASSLLTIMTASPAPSSAVRQDGVASTKKENDGVPMRTMIVTTCFVLGTIAVIYGGSGSSSNNGDVLYDSSTDYCFKSTTVDQYCWYPTDRFPKGPWKGVSGVGDNHCGLMCNQFPDSGALPAEELMFGQIISTSQLK